MSPKCNTLQWGNINMDAFKSRLHNQSQTLKIMCSFYALSADPVSPDPGWTSTPLAAQPSRELGRFTLHLTAISQPSLPVIWLVYTDGRMSLSLFTDSPRFHFCLAPNTPVNCNPSNRTTVSVTQSNPLSGESLEAQQSPPFLSDQTALCSCSPNTQTNRWRGHIVHLHQWVPALAMVG